LFLTKLPGLHEGSNVYSVNFFSRYEWTQFSFSQCVSDQC